MEGLIDPFHGSLSIVILYWRKCWSTLVKALFIENINLEEGSTNPSLSS